MHSRHTQRLQLARPQLNLQAVLWSQEDLAASAGGDDAFEAYCAELEGTAAWGGQVELQVCVDSYLAWLQEQRRTALQQDVAS